MCNEAYRLLAFYTVSFDTQELIDRSVRALDAHLNIAKVCAKAHFAAISNDSVVYDVVDSYDKLMQVVME